MALMNVRFVITGACYVGYSGRQIQLKVPVTQPDGTRTTVADVEAQVRNEWPNELSEMAESIKTAELKILKTGRLLTNTDIFEEQLTSTELASCEVVDNDGKTAEEIERSSVLMHLVFQKERQSKKPKEKPSKKDSASSGGGDEASANANTNANTNANANNNNNGRESKGDDCCHIM